jgi:cation:H+ antiporter
MLLIVSLFLLWKGADLVVHSAARIAHRFCLPDLVIGLTVVALGTSAPEISVTLLAAMKGQPDIALGNVVGSNVFNMGLILGTTALLRACPIPRLLVRRDAPMLLLATIILLICVSDRTVARWEGVTMEVLFLLYLLYLFRRDQGPIEEHTIPTGSATFWDVPILILGLCGLIAGGALLVDSASTLARAVGVSEWAIAVTIVAAGTSAPECATCIVAVLHGRHSMATGNLIGSDLFNILGVLGLAAIMRPLSVSTIAPGSVILMVAMVATVLIFMRSGWRLSRAEGLALIGFALMRWSRDIAPQLWS